VGKHEPVDISRNVEFYLILTLQGAVFVLVIDGREVIKNILLSDTPHLSTTAQNCFVFCIVLPIQCLSAIVIIHIVQRKKVLPK